MEAAFLLESDVEKKSAACMGRSGPIVLYYFITRSFKFGARMQKTR